jgi:2'-5' RNA ligase
MIRLFVALALPDSVAEDLLLLQGGVPGARWSERE